MKLFVLLLSVFLLTSGCTQPSSNSSSNSSPQSSPTDTHTKYWHSQLTLTPSTLPQAEVGKPYDVKISAVNKESPIDEMSIQSEPLPKGINIREIKEGEDQDMVAEISGTPKEPGWAKFTIKISCYGTQMSGQKLEQEFQLVVK